MLIYDRRYLIEPGPPYLYALALNIFSHLATVTFTENCSRVYH
jgi:hypothetical protein